MFPANLSLESRVPRAHRPGEAGGGASANSLPPISDPHSPPPAEEMAVRMRSNDLLTGGHSSAW